MPVTLGDLKEMSRNLEALGFAHAENMRTWKACVDEWKRRCELLSRDLAAAQEKLRVRAESFNDLRLTLLWHFWSTDPQLIHERCETHLLARNIPPFYTQTTLPFEQMLERSRRRQ